MGLTGTPINRFDKNTFATFGAEEDRAGYMSRYSFSDSIRDGAALPLRFEPVPIELHVDKDKLNREFEIMSEGRVWAQLKRWSFLAVSIFELCDADPLL